MVQNVRNVLWAITKTVEPAQHVMPTASHAPSQPPIAHNVQKDGTSTHQHLSLANDVQQAV